MKINHECLPCLINQAVKISKIGAIKNKEDFYHRVFKYLSTIDFDQTNPEIIGEVFKFIKEQSNNDDPYHEIRKYYNLMLLNKEQEFEKEINQNKDDFLTALKYAIIANIIDFNPQGLKLENIFQHFNIYINKPLAIDDHIALLSDICNSKILLYLGDNCGEICLDKTLLKKIKAINPSLQIFFATRGKPVVNDVIEEDAYLVGIDQYATIINNGDYSLGTILNRASREFKNIYDQADLVIAKGQANFESLSEEDKNIYFLLIIKCNVIAQYLNNDINELICMKQQKNHRIGGKLKDKRLDKYEK